MTSEPVRPSTSRNTPPYPEALNELFAEDTRTVVHERLRLAIAVLFLSDLFYVVVDKVAGTSPAGIIWVQGAIGLISIGLLLARQLTWIQDRAIGVAHVFVFFAALLVGSACVLRHDIAASAALFAVFSMGVSALLPWGFRHQLVCNAYTAVVLGATLVALDPPRAASVGLPMVTSLVLAGLASLIVAYQFRRYRHSMLEENFKLARSERILRESEARILSLNAELERRVQTRTSELRESNERLETAVEEMRSFTSAVSHDLRQPLRSVNGLLEIIEDESGAHFGDEDREYFARVRAAVVRMGGMIDDLLGLSRVSSARLERTTIDLGELATAIIADLRREAPDRELELDIHDDLLVEADPGLTLLLMQNLLGNAWKFTGREDRARIEVGQEVGADGERIYFVRDDGIGFDMAFADQLFGTFQRLRAADDYDGTGIGLATVARIVRRHGGRVWAEGAPNQGATLRFTLAPSPHAAVSACDDPAESPGAA